MWLAFLLFGCLSLFLCCSVHYLLYLKCHYGYFLLSPTSHLASPPSESTNQFENEASVSSHKNQGDCQELIKNKKSVVACRGKKKESATLPPDVWMKILLKLPGKSLMRCKRVCKSWYHLISDSGFILKHLSQYTCNPEVLSPLLFAGLADKELFSFISLDDGGKWIDHGASISVIDVASFIDPGNLCSLLSLYYEGHCHGVVCLCDRFSKSGLFALWNPTTGEFRILPRSTLTFPSFYGPIGWMGFGYDAMTNDFKLVQARKFQNFPNYEGTEPPVELYTLSTNSWTLLDVDVELVSPLHNNRCCMIAGCLWWPIMHEVEHLRWSFSLLRFDLNSEVFHKIMPPEDLQGVRDEIPQSSILALDDRVALIIYDAKDLRIERCFDIWVMEESSGDDVSWSKILSIGPILAYEPLAFWGNNRFLLFRNTEGVILYELSTQKIKHTKLNVGSEFNRYQIVVFKDSLLRIGN
ncbi:hypothetical protein Ancab_040297 [Ancistrocladus abbreviatus]